MSIIRFVKLKVKKKKRRINLEWFRIWKEVPGRITVVAWFTTKLVKLGQPSSGKSDLAALRQIKNWFFSRQQNVFT